MSGRSVLVPEEESRIWDLYIQRVPITTIARELNRDRGTITRAIERMQAALAEGQRESLEGARREALATYDLIQREAWSRLQQCKPDSTASVGYLGVLTDARRQQDRLLGLEQLTINHRAVHLARIETIMSTPITIAHPEDPTHA